MTIMEKVAEVSPMTYRFLKEAAPVIKESPFRDEIVQEMDTAIKNAEGKVKEANAAIAASLGQAATQAAPSTMGLAGRAAVGLGAAVGTGILYSLAGDLFDAAKRGLTKGLHYKAMLKNNPDLRERPADDVKKVFGVLHRFNPEFASDPYVSGSFVRDNLRLAGSEVGQVDLHSISNLIGARKNLLDTKRLPIPGNIPFEVGPAAEHRSLQIQDLQQKLHPENQELAKALQKAQVERHQAETAEKKDPLKRQHLELQVGRMQDEVARQSAQDSSAMGGSPTSARLRKFLSGRK